MRSRCSVAAALFALAACASPTQSPATIAPAVPSSSPPPRVEPQVHLTACGCDLEATLTPDKARFTAGEPVYLTLRLASACDKPLAIVDGGDDRNRFGRADSFKLAAYASNGGALVPLDPGSSLGGISAPHPLAKGKPFEKRLLLAHWFDFTEAGRYEITVEKALDMGEAMTVDTRDTSQVPVKVATAIEVMPASMQALTEVTAKLGADVMGDDDRARAEAMAALLTIKDRIVLRILVKVIETKDVSLAMQAVWGLRAWPDDEALDGYRAALHRSELRLAAAQSLADNAHPEAWEWLWGMRRDKDENIRLTVLHALAKKKPSDVRNMLLLFFQDPSKTVRDEAKRYRREM